MTMLHTIRPSEPRRYSKPRVGRGGKRGTTSGHGTKGQKSRSGHRIRPAERDFIQRLPKLRGIKNRSLKEKSSVVNVGDLAAFPGTTVNLKTLIEAGYVRGSVRKVKILGEGELKKALTVEGVEVSASAKAKIEAAKGTVANKNNG